MKKIIQSSIPSAAWGVCLRFKCVPLDEGRLLKFSSSLPTNEFSSTSQLGGRKHQAVGVETKHSVPLLWEVGELSGHGILRLMVVMWFWVCSSGSVCGKGHLGPLFSSSYWWSSGRSHSRLLTISLVCQKYGTNLALLLLMFDSVEAFSIYVFMYLLHIYLSQL